MDMKILVLLLLGVSLLAFGCAGKKAQDSPTLGAGDDTTPAANDTADDSEDDSGMADDSEDGAMDDEDDAMDDDSEENESMNASKDLSDLADLFRVDTDKPLEGEGLDVKSVDSNESD